MRYYRIVPKAISDEEFLSRRFYSEPLAGGLVPCLACQAAGREKAMPARWDDPEFDPVEYCPACGGWGEFEYDPGNPYHVEQYRREGLSCFESIDELVAYVFCTSQAVTERWEDEGEGLTVIVFEGREVGRGIDGEVLAIPERVVGRMDFEEIEKIPVTREHYDLARARGWY